jgi:hypothetical protein
MVRYSLCDVVSTERMRKQWNHYTQEEKGVTLRRHLLDREPISELCDELGLQPTVFYCVSRRIHTEMDRKLDERKQRQTRLRKTREERISEQFRFQGEVDNFRVAENTSRISFRFPYSRDQGGHPIACVHFSCSFGLEPAIIPT